MGTDKLVRMRILQGFAATREESLSTQLRRRRFALFQELVAGLPKPLRILDVGGTPKFWQLMQFEREPDVQVVLLNREAPEVPSGRFQTVTGDARAMPQFRSGEFDIVFSNSVIEHVGDFADQQATAEDIRRIGRRYFVQTPNRYFPIEPHFLFPCFQFLPIRARVALIQRVALGWYPRVADPAEARRLATSIRLLDERQLRALFPGATIYSERVLGWTKSFVAHRGFS